MSIKLMFWDFDGTLFDSPLPEIGKPLYKELYGQEYPHQGWWGRLESMDPKFDIQPNKQVLDIFRSHEGPMTFNYILTSRLPKFKPAIHDLLHKFNIDMRGIMTMSNLDKGQRILHTVKEYMSNNVSISEVYFFDDRDKEIVAVNAVKSELEQLGIKVYITKIESENHK